MANLDQISAFTILVVIIGLGLSYSLRLVTLGRAHYQRVDRQGSSPLLSKALMEMTYWGLQPIGRLLIRIGMTANGISWTSLGLGALSGILIAGGAFGMAALLASVSALFDSLDGMVARETGTASDVGEVLDASIDRYTEFFFLGGLVIYYRQTPAWMLIALFALIGSFMVSYATAKAEALDRVPPPGLMRRPERTFYLIFGAFVSALSWPIPVDLTSREYPMLASLILVAVFSNASAIRRLYIVAESCRPEGAKESGS
jgi:CDP-diacylglycerol---glycerol-3-phosphate 3-phosphatidyltransferase